jgi:hypothetical protein
VQLISAGRGDDAHLPTGALAVFGSVGVREHVELPDCVHPQELAARPSGRDVNQGSARVLNSV